MSSCYVNKRCKPLHFLCALHRGRIISINLLTWSLPSLELLVLCFFSAYVFKLFDIKFIVIIKSVCLLMMLVFLLVSMFTWDHLQNKMIYLP